jgi:uncharacterized protein YjaZ
MKKTFMLIILLTFALKGISQKTLYADPDSSAFITTDIDNFWKAYDDFKKDTTKNTFGPEYIVIGSEGVKGFIPYRLVSADNLLKVVKKREADYVKMRDKTFKMKDTEKQCRSSFYALKYWYPQAKFPPVYFVIGAFNTGGNAGPTGLQIGAEMQDNIDNILPIVAHELIHYQQTNGHRKLTLLEQSILEGTADFLAELISGIHGNKTANAYGDKHTDKLCREFISKMDQNDYTDWMYSVSGKDDRPNDLGYWIGYKIAAQYFAKSTDKKQAVDDLLNMKDFKVILDKSEYLDAYLKK